MSADPALSSFPIIATSSEITSVPLRQRAGMENWAGTPPNARHLRSGAQAQRHNARGGATTDLSSDNDTSDAEGPGYASDGLARSSSDRGRARHKSKGPLTRLLRRARSGRRGRSSKAEAPAGAPVSIQALRTMASATGPAADEDVPAWPFADPQTHARATTAPANNTYDTPQDALADDRRRAPARHPMQSSREHNGTSGEDSYDVPQDALAAGYRPSRPSSSDRHDGGMKRSAWLHHHKHGDNGHQGGYDVPQDALTQAYRPSSAGGNACFPRDAYDAPQDAPTHAHRPSSAGGNARFQEALTQTNRPPSAGGNACFLRNAYDVPQDALASSYGSSADGQEWLANNLPPRTKAPPYMNAPARHCGLNADAAPQRADYDVPQDAIDLLARRPLPTVPAAYDEPQKGRGAMRRPPSAEAQGADQQPLREAPGRRRRATSSPSKMHPSARKHAAEAAVAESSKEEAVVHQTSVSTPRNLGPYHIVEAEEVVLTPASFIDAGRHGTLTDSRPAGETSRDGEGGAALRERPSLSHARCISPTAFEADGESSREGSPASSPATPRRRGFFRRRRQNPQTSHTSPLLRDLDNGDDASSAGDHSCSPSHVPRENARLQRGRSNDSASADSEVGDAGAADEDDDVKYASIHKRQRSRATSEGALPLQHRLSEVATVEPTPPARGHDHVAFDGVTPVLPEADAIAEDGHEQTTERPPSAPRRRSRLCNGLSASCSTTPAPSRPGTAGLSNSFGSSEIPDGFPFPGPPENFPSGRGQGADPTVHRLAQAQAQNSDSLVTAPESNGNHASDGRRASLEGFGFGDLISRSLSAISGASDSEVAMGALTEDELQRMVNQELPFDWRRLELGYELVRRHGTGESLQTYTTVSSMGSGFDQTLTGSEGLPEPAAQALPPVRPKRGSKGDIEASSSGVGSGYSSSDNGITATRPKLLNRIRSLLGRRESRRRGRKGRQRSHSAPGRDQHVSESDGPYEDGMAASEAEAEADDQLESQLAYICLVEGYDITSARRLLMAGMARSSGLQE